MSAAVDETYYFFADVSYSLGDVFRALPGYWPRWSRTKGKPIPTWRLRAKRRYSKAYNAEFEGNYWRLTGTLYSISTPAGINNT